MSNLYNRLKNLTYRVSLYPSFPPPIPLLLSLQVKVDTLTALKGIQLLKMKFCVQKGHIKIILCLFVIFFFFLQKTLFLKFFQKKLAPTSYLPAVQHAIHLPSRAIGLPSTAIYLPSAGYLPAVRGHLPAVHSHLPAVRAAR